MSRSEDSNEHSPLRALVTGSSTGIGAAIAYELAKSGAQVVVHGRTLSKELGSIVQAIEDCGGCAKPIAWDFVSSVDDGQASHLKAFAEQAWDQFDGLDVLVNNAGGDVLTGGASNWSFETRLQYLLKVDVAGSLLLSRIIGRQMMEQAGANAGAGTKSIVNIGWDQAEQGMAGDSAEIFSATKGAIMAMTRSLAQSLAPAVRVNCVAPGWIRTEWGASASSSWQHRAASESLMNRWGTPTDVADVVAFLVSERANFISGQVIPINGGFKYFQEDDERS